MNPVISIVSTMYYSEAYVEEFYVRCKEVLKKLEVDNYEFVFVDDGSPDNSHEKAIEIAKKDQNVTVLGLSKNYGHNKAIATGLKYTRGEYVFLIDMDLEEPPELLECFWDRMCKCGESVDVIYGVQEQRKGKSSEKITGGVYYKVFNWLSDELKIEPNISTVKLMQRGFVDHLRRFESEEFYFGAVCIIAGFKQVPLYFKKESHSETTYNFIKKYKLFFESVFGFSKKPLYLIFYLGLFVTLMSFLFGAVLIVKKIAFGAVLGGWTSIMVSIWFLGGLIILFLGVMSIYLAKIFSQTKGYPFTIVKSVYKKG